MNKEIWDIGKYRLAIFSDIIFIAHYCEAGTSGVTSSLQSTVFKL